MSSLDNATMPMRTGLVALGSKTGVGTTLQLAPSQWIASVARLPLSPTAQTSLDATMATPKRSLSFTPPLGLGTTFQLAPSQWIVSVRSSPDPPGRDRPTAQ